MHFQRKNRKKYKGAIIGYGFISGKGHLPAYLEREDVEIVAIADICEARLAEARKVLPEAHAYNTYQELFQQEKDLDFIDISTPPSAHAEIACAALERGWHVLCEKPLAVNTEAASKMIATAKRCQKVLFPCHNYKHAPVVKTIQSIIEAGKIGIVRSLTLQTFRYTHAKGVKEWRTDWRREFAYSGGGIAMDHGSHTFYLTFSWLKNFPLSVSASTTNLDPKWDTEDTLHCVLKFPNGMVNAFLSWEAGARKMIYTIEGSEGAIFVNNDDIEVVKKEETVEKFSIRSDWMDASHTTWFNSMFDQFLNCIETEDYVNSEIKESYLCVDIIEKCYRSSKENSREQKIESNLSF